MSIRGSIEVRQSLKSLSAHSLFLDFVFMAVSAEKPASQRYVVENGNNTDTALLAISGYSDAAYNQKLDRPISVNFVFNVSFCLHVLYSSNLG